MIGRAESLAKKSFAVLLCSALISGCASLPSPPERFTGDRQSTPIHELTVAVVMPRLLRLNFNDMELRAILKSANGIANVGGNGKFLQSGIVLLLRSIYNPEKFYRGILEVYHQDFKNVVPVESISDPRVAQADLIAIPDVSYSMHTPGQNQAFAVLFILTGVLPLIFTLPMTTKVSLEVSTVFYSPDHSPITTVKVQSPVIKKHRPIAFTPDLRKLFPVVNEQAAAALDLALENSPELRQFAQSLASKAVAQAKSGRKENAPAKIFDSDVDRPTYTFGENPDSYAVVVGVESYQNMPAAAFAKRDAEAMRSHLRALGYPSPNITILTDSQATGNKLKSYIESWLPRNVKPDSKVFFYFAGLGASETESKQAYLLPWDGDPQFVSDTGYPLKRLYQQLDGLKAKEVIVALDACFSGAGGRSTLAKGARPLVTQVRAGGSSDLGKVVVLAAAGAEEITGEEESQGHGLFTYYLLKSLNESSGKDTVGQIYSYLKPLVEDAARRSNRGQTPQMLGGDVDQGAKESLY